MPDNNALPLFEQPISRNVKVVPGNRADSIAHTNGLTDRVYVDDPKLMTEPIMAHELMHQIQRQSGAMPRFGTGGSPEYDYGSVAGLKNLRSISQLGLEQQADLPRNYQEQMQEWSKGRVTPQILQNADQMNDAFARPIRQEASMARPGNTIDTTPAAPGPPPAALTGMIKPLPEIGGQTLYRSK